MISNVISCPWLRGLPLSATKSYVQVITCFDCSRIIANRPYQICNLHLKTSSDSLLSKVSRNFSDQSYESLPERVKNEVGMMTAGLEEQIMSALTTYPKLTQVSVGVLKNFLRNMCELGFSVDDGIVMVSKCTIIIELSKTRLLQSVMGFRQCKFSDEEIKSILRMSPEHILVNPAAIVSRYFTLRKQFSHKSLKYIFSNCPRIGLIQWEVIQNKMEYLGQIMKVPSHEIAQSSALDCKLVVIKARHLFLERAGLFKPPNPKSSVPHTNHNLSKIVDSEDEYFASKVAGLTPEEYFVFQELLALEDVLEDSDSDMENVL